MRKSTKIVKRIMALFLVVLMSINSFGAVVSDNDGSAFITKAEFDSLKNNFQAQIDQYNTSIDSKIDGAIAGYLSGIKLGKKNPLTLDRKSMYTFPMTCFIDGNKLWNDEHSSYYCVSLPQLESKTYGMQLSKFNSDCVITDDAYVISPGRAAPITVPTRGNGTVRIQWGCDRLYFPGRIGSAYRITYDGASWRAIDGTARHVWSLRDVVTGQDIIKYSSGNFGSPWDGSNTEFKVWSDYYYIGYHNNRPWTKHPGAVWDGPTSDNTNQNAWTSQVLKCSYNHYQVGNAYAKPESGYDTRTVDNFADTAYWRKSEQLDSFVPGSNGNNSDILGAPDSRVLNVVTSSDNHMVFAGTAFLPSHNDGGFCLQPRALADTAANTKVTYQNIFTHFRDTLFFWNHTGASQVAGPYNNRWHVVWPEWHANANNNWKQESSDDFSMIRASVVSYEDSNGKTHYLDEGLYLGKYEDEGKVEFKIKFNGNNGISTRFALSKKPFGFNRNDNDRIKFKFTIDAEPTTPAIEVPAGGYGAINTNYTITIKVDDIEKNDELYMIWWPENSGDYVELDNITEYYLETTG